MQLDEYDQKEIFCGKNKSGIEKQKPNGCIDELEDDVPAISLETKPADPLKVYCIDFHGKKLKEIVNISKFSNCKSADFSCNEIKEISLPDRNTEICELKLYSNEISELKGLDKLRKLQTLQLQHNKINKIGDGLKSLKNLKVLRLSSNCLNGLEANELNSCCNLAYLDLSYNNIKNVNLQEVDLSHNMITNVAGLKTLPKLTVVNVSHNRLQDLVSLSTTRSLQQLDASKNSITDLVHILQQFPNLEILNLSKNCVNRWKKVQYLRELPEPLLTFDLYEDWIQASSITERDARLQALWTVCDRLPSVNKSNLKYIICFLAKIAENSEVNKMSSSNIAIVIAPNLLWMDGDNSGLSVLHTGNSTTIIDSLVQHCDWFFPEGVVFTRRDSQNCPSPRQQCIKPAADDSEHTDVPSMSGLLSEVSQLLDFPSSTTAGLLQTSEAEESTKTQESEPPVTDNRRVVIPPLPTRPPPSLPPRGEPPPKPYTGHKAQSSAPFPNSPSPPVPGKPKAKISS